MRAFLGVLLVTTAACSSTPPTVSPPPHVDPAPLAPAPASAPPPDPAQPKEPVPERLAADTPKTTVAGNTFIAPEGWSLVVKGPATILTAPEPGSRIALIDVQAKDADAAVELAWAAYKPEKKWPLKVSTGAPDRDGWTNIRNYEYQTSPNEKRDVDVNARLANNTWTVVIYDV